MNDDLDLGGERGAYFPTEWGDPPPPGPARAAWIVERIRSAPWPEGDPPLDLLGYPPDSGLSAPMIPKRPTISGGLARHGIGHRYRDPSLNRQRTLPGSEAVRDLRDRMDPESRGTIRSGGQPLPGAQPPHGTETSSRTWWGASASRADLGPKPSFRQVADSHAWVGYDGAGLHMHHEIKVDRGASAVGAANVSACQQALTDHHRQEQGSVQVPICRTCALGTAPA